MVQDIAHNVVKQYRTQDNWQIRYIPPTIKKQRSKNQKGLACFYQMFFIEIKIDKKGKRQKEKYEFIRIK